MMSQELERQKISKLLKGLQVIADSALLRKREGVSFIAGTGGKPQSCGRWFVPTIEYRFTIGCLSENCVDEMNMMAAYTKA